MRHDTIRMDTEVTREARARLPKQIAAERQFRVSRALHLDAKQQILPKEEWMTLEKASGTYTHLYSYKFLSVTVICDVRCSFIEKFLVGV